MKKFLNSPAFLIGLIIAAILAIAATSATTTRYSTAPEKAQILTWSLDTIADAANDTLTMGLQTSNWYGLLQLDGKQLSGTQGIAVIVQHSAFASPDSDQWAESTRDTLNGSLEQLVIDLGRLEASNYRIIMDGYGTQSTEYEASLVLKKD